jgi:hypothetical protein
VNVAIFGGLGRRPFPPGWTRETVLALFGGGNLDLSQSAPGAGARLTALAILGGVNIALPPGTQVSTSGFSLFGGRDVRVSQRGDGPQVRLSLWAFFGAIKVTEGGVPDDG